MIPQFQPLVNGIQSERSIPQFSSGLSTCSITSTSTDAFAGSRRRPISRIAVKMSGFSSSAPAGAEESPRSAWVPSTRHSISKSYFPGRPVLSITGRASTLRCNNEVKNAWITLFWRGLRHPRTWAHDAEKTREFAGVVGVLFQL